MPREVETQLRAMQSWVIGGVLFLLLFTLSMTSLMIWQAFRIGDQAAQLRTTTYETHTALCTFKRDLHDRWERGVEFLEEHPAGIPGIPKQDLQRSIDAQAATLKSLAPLKCS